MDNYIKEIINNKDQTLSIVCEYIVNTIKAKNLYRKGGWGEVKKNFSDKDCFNHNFSISDISICMKLRENKEPITCSIRNNMQKITDIVNKNTRINAVKYSINNRNHKINIII